MVSGSPFAAAGDVRPPPGFSSSPWIGSEARAHRWSGSRAPSPEGRAETREDRPSVFNRAMGALIPSAEAAEPNVLREPPDDDGPWLYYRTGTRLPKCPDDITVVRNNCLGTFVSSGGAKYVGEFRDDKFNGKGTLYAPNGSVRYVGQFQDGKFNAPGDPNIAAKAAGVSRARLSFALLVKEHAPDLARSVNAGARNGPCLARCCARDRRRARGDGEHAALSRERWPE